MTNIIQFKAKSFQLERLALRARAKKLRAEIAQIFADAEHWNTTHPDDVPINPDPDGKLAQLYDSLK